MKTLLRALALVSLAAPLFAQNAGPLVIPEQSFVNSVGLPLEAETEAALAEAPIHALR